MPAQLIALTDGPNILLDKPILLLGRHPECDIQIDSRKISRRHCCIAQVNEFLVIRDLGSTNGIRVNGVRMQEGKLKPDDEVTIGNSRYRVLWDSLAIESPPLREVRDIREGQPAPPPVMKPVRPTKLDAVDDAILESCDEPVPLEEPMELAPRPQIPLPIQSEPHILPENLELAPLSDIIPPPSAK